MKIGVMSHQTPDTDGTDTDRTDKHSDSGAALAGPETLEATFDRQIPKPLGDHFAVAYDIESTPETFGELIEGFQIWAERRELWPPTFDDLCRATGSEALQLLEIDGEIHQFHCAIDPLLATFLHDEDEAVVRSKSPLEGADITVRIEGDDAEVTPSTAVVSIGAFGPVNRFEGDEHTSEEAYEQLGASVHAFPNRTTYEAWAEENPEMTTMSMPIEEGIELARRLAGDR